MPSVAVICCERCGSSSEHGIANGPIPVVSACPCGGQRQIARIVFRPRQRSQGAGAKPGDVGRAKRRSGFGPQAAPSSPLRG